MVNEIELLVCDNCNTVMQAEVWRGHTCMDCGNEMIAAKFERQPTQRAADGGCLPVPNLYVLKLGGCWKDGLVIPRPRR